MRSVVYVSTASPAMSKGEVERLLFEARASNLKAGITGILLYSEGCFMQYIEGPTSALEATYRRIKASRRHTGLIELMNEPTPARLFSDWQLAFAEPTDSELLKLSTAPWRHAASAPPHDRDDHPEVALSLLRQFWARRR